MMSFTICFVPIIPGPHHFNFSREEGIEELG